LKVDPQSPPSRPLDPQRFVASPRTSSPSRHHHHHQQQQQQQVDEAKGIEDFIESKFASSEIEKKGAQQQQQQQQQRDVDEQEDEKKTSRRDVTPLDELDGLAQPNRMLSDLFGSDPQ